VMAQAAGVDFAAAGWSHSVSEIQAYMKTHATAYCARISDLGALILPQSQAGRPARRPAGA
jgi:hypothetical protein